MPFPPKTRRVHRIGDPPGEITVINASDFDSKIHRDPLEPAAEPEKTEPATTKRGRPPGAKNKPKG